MKISPVVAELFHVDRQKERRAETHDGVIGRSWQFLKRA